MVKFFYSFFQFIRFREIKHFAVAHIKSNTEVPVWSRCRQLTTDKYEAWKREIKQIVN